MTSALIVIGHAARAPLDSGLGQRLERRFGAALRWLAPGEALELLIEAGPPEAALGQAREELADRAVDLAMLPAAGRRKRLLVSDMDSTIITVECIDELADLVGLKGEVAAITRRAMNGELDFAAALRERVALLEGLPESVLEQVWRERVRLMPGAVTLVRTMRAHGATTILVSGGFLPIVERVRAAAGFDQAYANRLETRAGRLTGRVVAPIQGAGQKLRLLRRHARRLGIPIAATLALGDGANDLPMVQAAGLGVAYRAHPRLAEGAPVRVTHGDLTAILYLQGYARHEFAG
jgi:phosphoserine phosphatase